jgi:hypothetical protein
MKGKVIHRLAEVLCRPDVGKDVLLDALLTVEQVAGTGLDTCPDAAKELFEALVALRGDYSCHPDIRHNARELLDRFGRNV